MLRSVSLSRIGLVMRREAAIKRLHPIELIFYLWFSGVNPAQQNKGMVSILMNEIIQEAKAMQRTICLETSTQKNIPWYEKFGFEIYNEPDPGYPLFFMKKNK